MAYISVVVEIKNVWVQETHAAESQTTFQFDPPEGYQLLSWGWSNANPEVRLLGATISGDAPGHFSATVDNASVDPWPIRWTFVLMKV